MRKKGGFLFVIIVSLILSSMKVNAKDIAGTSIYGSWAEKNCFYERVVELNNGELLATWMREFPLLTDWGGMKSPVFYKSTDQGKTWNCCSELIPEKDGISGDKLGMPGMFVLPQDMGQCPAGTILYATSDWNADNAYTIHIWRSTDQGKTWQMHSELAPRGNRSTWEPEFAVTEDGRLICFYSDERQSGYDQCIAYELSNDGGITWDGYTIVAGEYEEGWIAGVSEGNWRPGMPRVLRLKDGSYIMVYENIHTSENGIITVRHSRDGIDWGSPLEMGIPVTDGVHTAFQCPTIALIDDGTANGRLFLRGMNDNCSASQCFTSTDNGYTWSLIDAPLTAVRNEAVGSSWSGTFLTSGNKLIEINNYYNGTYNEIRCNSGILYGNQMIISGADYEFVNTANRLCMDDPAGSMEMGTQMILWNRNRERTQSWCAEEVGFGVYRIKSNHSGLFLDNENGSSHSGSIVRQWEDNGAEAERWLLEIDSSDSFRIKNVAGNLYLDTENASDDIHANLVVASYSDSNTQKWHLERILEVSRFESYNIRGTYISHSGDGVIIDKEFTNSPLEDSEWRVVPGLADASCFSFESVNRPGYFLRHRNGVLELSTNTGEALMAADATWVIADGLADRTLISIRSYNMEDNYIRHKDGKLYISTVVSDIDRADATFRQFKQ